jgi:hypothetical protein
MALASSYSITSSRSGAEKIRASINRNRAKDTLELACRAELAAPTMKTGALNCLLIE